MASTATQPVLRRQLADALGDMRTVRAFEALTGDVRERIPAEIQIVRGTANQALTNAAAAQTSANNAQASADTAQLTADTALAELEDLVAQLNLQTALIWEPDADPPTLAYLCEAAPGALTSAAVWRVQRLTWDIAGKLTIEWADGNANFDNIADNRAALTYS